MVRSQHLWCLLYAIYKGQGGGVSVMCAILGCAAQVCLLAAVLCGSPATVCPYPMCTAGGLLLWVLWRGEKPKNKSWCGLVCATVRYIWISSNSTKFHLFNNFVLFCSNNHNAFLNPALKFQHQPGHLKVDIIMTHSTAFRMWESQEHSTCHPLHCRPIFWWWVCEDADDMTYI